MGMLKMNYKERKGRRNGGKLTAFNQAAGIYCGGDDDVFVFSLTSGFIFRKNE
jgi:hypothetical protein